MKNYKKLVTRNGFTLVEVMVVIAIIGILSAILYVSFQQAREQSRNTAMKAAIKEVQLALETYKAQYGFYPPLDTGVEAVRDTGSEREVDSRDFITAGYITGILSSVNQPPLEPDFISELPSHTISGNSDCSIYYITENSNTPNYYKLAATRCAEGVDDTTGTQADAEMAYCPESCGGTCPHAQNEAEFYESFAVYSLGGQCI